MTAPLRTVLALTLALASPAAWAGASHRTAGKTGLGLGGGTRSGGISVKHFLTKGTAVQGVVGAYGGWEGGGLGLNADYLIERPPIASGEVIDLAWNFGAGAGVGIHDNSAAVAVSGVLGLEFAFVPAPIDLVIEYRPTLGVVPGIGVDLINATGHLRWFF